MKEFVANVTPKSGGTITVTVLAHNADEAREQLIRWGYKEVRNITPEDRQATPAQQQQANAGGAKHTPTPWTATVFGDIRAQNGDALFTLPGRSEARLGKWGYEEAKQQDAANAKFIVTAVNAHDELVAALRQIADLQTWNECYESTPQKRLTKADISNTLDAAILAARAALAKVEG